LGGSVLRAKIALNNAWASIGIADQSTPSEKAARHVMLVLSCEGATGYFFLIGIRTRFSNPI
jgi:hypothetical protein